MHRLSSLLVMIVTLALSLAMSPVAASAHCVETARAPVAAMMHHDHAAMDHRPGHSSKKDGDKKAADCLLRCLNSCAGLTALGQTGHLVLAVVSARPRLPASVSVEGLQLRPLLPPPQPAFI